MTAIGDQILTPTQLRAVPNGTTLVDASGLVCQIHHGELLCIGTEITAPVPTIRDGFPFAVIHVPPTLAGPWAVVHQAASCVYGPFTDRAHAYLVAEACGDGADVMPLRPATETSTIDQLDGEPTFGPMIGR